MEEEVLKYLDFEGLSLYHQNIQTEFDQKVDKDDFYNDEKIIASALNDLNTRKVNNDDLANVATSGNYNDLNNKPTKVSEFTNDAGYVTELDISGKADQSDLEDLEEEVINNEEVIANALSILSDRIEDNEKVTASALTDLLEKKYEKPNGGIPSSDLAQAVQNLLTAAGTALQASDLNTLNSKVQTLETYFSNEADTDTIINKWNEIVAFLAGISESSTLDDIISNISGYYKNLHAGLADNIVGEFSDSSEVSFRPTAGAVDIESGKADKGAKITGIKGNTRAWNQQIVNGNFVNGGTWKQNFTSATFSDNTATCSTSQDRNNVYCGLYKDFHPILNHKYYVSCLVKTLVQNHFEIGFENQKNTFVPAALNTFIKLSCFILCDRESPFFIIYQYKTTENFTFQIKEAQCFDLTLIYGEGNEPSTPAAFEADYQKWFGKPLTYEAYDAGSLRPVKMTGIKTVGFNAWDEEWEVGDIGSSGALISSNTNLRSKNFCRCVGGQRYYFKAPTIPSGGKNIFWYDADKNFISYDFGTYVAPANAAYFKIAIDNYISTYSTYQNDICINLSHSGARDGEYEPYWSSMLNVPVTTLKGKLNGEGSSVVVFPDGLKKAGTVYDEIVRRGDKTYAIKRVGSVDMGTLGLTGPSNNSGHWKNDVFVKGDALPLAKPGTHNLLCSKYVYFDDLNSYVCTLDKVFDTISTSLYVKDASCSTQQEFDAAISGVILYYELATPEEYLLDDFELPQEYDVDDYGTEEVLLGTNGIAPVLDIKYGINAPDTIKNLPHSYVSAVGKQNFTEAQKIRARANIGLLNRKERLTSFSIDTLKKAVEAQDLELYGLKVGDETTINGHTYVIAGLNAMKGATGFTCTSNHVALICIPHTTQAWNASGNTYTGADERGAGYKNSDLHYYLKNTLLPLVETDLGAANLLAHHKLLSSAVNTSGINRFGEATGCSSSWDWEADCKICALSEAQVYGGTIWSSSGYDTGEAAQQLEVFSHFNKNEIFGSEYPWLRDVVSVSYAAYVYHGGNADRSDVARARTVAALILFK